MGGPPRFFLGEHVQYMARSPDVADRTGADPVQIFKGAHNHDQTWSLDGQWIYFAHGMG
jgi:hypothetical protein